MTQFIPAWAESALSKPAKFTDEEIATARDPLQAYPVLPAPSAPKREIITLKGKRNGRR